MKIIGKLLISFAICLFVPIALTIILGFIFPDSWGGFAGMGFISLAILIFPISFPFTYFIIAKKFIPY